MAGAITGAGAAMAVPAAGDSHIETGSPPAVRLVIGDCLQVLPQLRRDKVLVDCVVADPPYHLTSIVERLGKPGSVAIQSGATGVYARSSSGFMGQQWDGGDVAFQAETWTAVFEVMKPGGFLVAFAAPRTYDLLVAAVRAAGFEIRDRLWNAISEDEHVARFLESLSAEQRDAFALVVEASQFGCELAWMFGSGFPKSHNIKGDDLQGTALKPAYEPILLARKPSPLPVPENVATYGVGALQIDAARVGTESTVTEKRDVGVLKFAGGNGRRSHGRPETERVNGSAKGRWPANVTHDGSDQVLEAFAAFGEKGAAAPVQQRNSDVFRGVYGAFRGNRDDLASSFHADQGSAARFFYSAKAKASERVYRCRQCGEHRLGKPKCGHRDERGNLDLQGHPTVKPLGLMEWLVRLVCPPGGLVLDPFAGTGTTGAAAMAAGCSALLIERERTYADDIAVRLGQTLEQLTAAAVAPIASTLDTDGPLFDLTRDRAA